MSRNVKHIYEFGPFELDSAEGFLRVAGREIPLSPTPYGVLLALVENAGHIVERNSLMKRGWPESTIVDEANLNQQISVLRRTLRETDGNQEYIETLPHRGYRFIVPVKVSEVVVSSEGEYILVISATIKDVDKPMAAAIEAHLRKLSNDVTLTLTKIDRGSIVLTFRGTREGFERIEAQVTSGGLVDIFGLKIERVSWSRTFGQLEKGSPRARPRESADLSGWDSLAIPHQGTIALTPQAFERLLSWLSVDRDVAAKRYESIRQKLVAFFGHRGADRPDELADATIDSVAKKLDQANSVDPESYFLAIARRIHLSYVRPSPLSAAHTKLLNEDTGGDIRKNECLSGCLRKLSAADRDLIKSYYASSSESVLNRRRELAAKLGLTPSVLRMRIFRIRTRLRTCVNECLEK